ncbi:PDGLE domain-containing protein [Clostridium magnum]
MQDYSFRFLNENYGYILSALVGVIIILITFKVLGKIDLNTNIKED